MRMTGWTAVALGLTTLALAIATDSIALDLLGSYGLLVAVTGTWIVGGLKILSRREAAVAERHVAARAVPQRSANLG
jgi:hypothetical protein